MPAAGETLLHYRILEKIGEGGMGVVYKALDTHLDRNVAVKVLPPDKVADMERRQRFVQEAKAASALNHPNIVVVHDITEDRGTNFIVMEYVEGKTLDQLVGRDVCNACLILGFFSDPNFALILENGRQLVKYNIATGEKLPILDAGAGRIRQPALSPDDRWVAFILDEPDGKAAVYISPLAGNPVPQKDWVLLFEEDHYLGSPAWSSDGYRLYYLSEREGPCSVWTQKLDPRSKKPDGKTQAVYRPSSSSLQLNYPRGNGTLAVADDKLVIWGGQGCRQYLYGDAEKA